MFDTVAFVLALVLAGGSLLALLNWLIKIDQKRAEISEEGYENRERGANLIGIGMMAFDELIRPEMKKAAEYRIDAEQGNLPSGEREGPPTDRESNPTPTGIGK